MNIDIKETITLSDKKEYVVISKAIYQDKTYYYIIDIADNKNIKFCEEVSSNNSLIVVKDKELLKNLLPLFFDNIKDVLKEIDFSKFEQ
jgi:hypothetical protein